MGVAVKLGGLCSKAQSVCPYFGLGGFLQLSGLRAGELRSDQFALARLMSFRKMGDLAALQRGIYFGGSLEAGHTDSPNNNINPDRLVYAGSVCLGLETLIKPFYSGYGHATGSRRSAYFFRGRP